MEKLALQETIILKKIENLQNDLFIIRAEMEFLRKYPKDTQQKEISSPSSSQSQDETIPEQTALGKESTNPLMAVALPKSKTEVQTSTTLVKPSDLNLRPNGGIQIPEKTKDHSLAASQEEIRALSSKNYYVVYNGSNPGIYNKWEIASLAVSGISGVTHKKFKSFQEARVSADLYTTEMMKPPLQLINSAEGLKPTYKQALKKTSKPMPVLGMKNVDNLIINFNEDEDDGETVYDSFQYFYELGRIATENHFIEHRFFTSDKKNLSYFNYYPNANADMIYEAFVNGLVNLIYPSKNLLEISRFPKGFRDAIKKFRTKCLKNSDKEIFIKVQSSVPFWDEDYGLVKPFHYIQIGIVKEKLYSPSTSMKVSLEKEDLQELAFQKYANIVEKVLCLKSEDNIKINYAGANYLITSQSHQKMTKEESEALTAIQKRMVNGRHMMGSHYPQLCKDMDRIIKKVNLGADFLCPYCQQSDKDASKMVADSQ